MDATTSLLVKEGSDEVAEDKPMATPHGKKLVRGLFFAKGTVLLVAAICGINEYRSEKTANGTAEVVEEMNLREVYHLDRSDGELANTIDLNGAENAITTSGIDHEDGSDNVEFENFILGRGSAKPESSKYNVDLDPTLSPTLAPTLSPTLAPALPTAEEVIYEMPQDGVPGKDLAKPESSTEYDVDLDPTLSPTLAPTFSPTLVPALPTADDII